MSQHLAHHARMKQKQSASEYAARHKRMSRRAADYVGRHARMGVQPVSRQGAHRWLARFLVAVLFLAGSVAVLTGLVTGTGTTAPMHRAASGQVTNHRTPGYGPLLAAPEQPGARR